MPEPVLAPALVERVLAKLGLHQRPALDVAGLNTVYAAVSANIPFDNFQKRIWFAGPQPLRSPAEIPMSFSKTGCSTALAARAGPSMELCTLSRVRFVLTPNVSSAR